MRVVSLFAGIGGIDLGLERAGMTTVAQVENDPWCTQVLEKHWPTVPRWTDIHDVDPKELPDHDIIAGGFPCQPVSIAGTRLAQDDPRWLWPQFARIVRVVRPRYVLVENVPGLASAGMGDVLGDLAEIGYDAEWTSIPAAFVGAPHLRWRIFIVAYPAGGGEPPDGGVRGRDARGGGRPARPFIFTRPEVAYPADPQPASATLADADLLEDRGLHRRRQNETAAPISAGASEGGPVADPDRMAGTTTSSRDGQPGTVFEPGAFQRTLGRGSSPDQWIVEPDVGRVADGVPRRVDRLRGLGNAVVPQVAELIGRLIMEDYALQSNPR